MTGLIDDRNIYSAGELVGSYPVSSQVVNVAAGYSTGEEHCFNTDCYIDHTASAGGGLFYDEMNTVRIVGFNFLIDDNTHWGWAELYAGSFSPLNDRESMNVLRWGWETGAATLIAAGTGTIVPLPSAMLFFSTGLVGLLAISKRRRESRT